MTMANRQTECVLMKQVVSKLLDSQSVQLPQNSPLLQVLQPTVLKSHNYANTSTTKTAGPVMRKRIQWQRKNNPLEKNTIKKTVGIVLVLIGWILLVLNVLMVLVNLDYGQKLPLSMHIANGRLSVVFMLLLGVFVLGWTTWLYLRHKPCKTIVVPVLIILVFAMSLTFLVKESENGIAKAQALGRKLLSSVLVTTAPTDRFVSGILYSEDKPSAVIDNQVVYEGDAFNGIKVVRIYKDRVECEKNGKRWTLSIGNNLTAESPI